MADLLVRAEGGIMSAVIDQPEQVAPPGRTDRGARRSRVLSFAVVILAVALIGAIAWIVFEPTDESSDRYEKASATQQTVTEIIADPAAFGTEEEVLDLLDELAVPEVVSGDLAFGGVSTGVWRIGWRNTLFGSDATLRTWTTWLSDDGSVGGSLWTWSGTAANGEPFDLQGLELSRFNDDGLYTEVVMLYPYDDEEVRRRFREGN